jgi:hypothetical protein
LDVGDFNENHDPDGKFSSGGGSGGGGEGGSSSGEGSSSGGGSLTSREHEIMQVVLKERSDKKVLERIKMGRTEAMHALNAIRTKLGVDPSQSLRAAYKAKFSAKA